MNFDNLCDFAGNVNMWLIYCTTQNLHRCVLLSVVHSCFLMHILLCEIFYFNCSYDRKNI